MKKISLLLIFSFVAFFVNAQIKEPAKWSEPRLSKSAPSVGETVDIIFDVTIEKGWYLYSSDFDPDLGPIVTTFDYEGSEGIELVGGIKAINPKKEFDDLWGGDYTYFEPKGQFKQTIKITKENPIVKAKAEFQTCQHDGSCISSKKKFSINIKTSAKKVETVKEVKPKEVVKETVTNEPKEEINIEVAEEADSETTDTSVVEEVVSIEKEEPIIKVPEDNSSVFYASFLQLEPKESDPKITFKDSDIIALLKLVQTKKDYNDATELIEGAKNFKELKKNSKIREIVVTHADSFSINNPLWAESLFGIIFMAFSFGLAALLTPCVFPLIPMTVTFFMKDGKNKGLSNAIIYGISIVAIYTLIGVGVSFFFGANAANQMATSAISNIIFFVIFMVFAASFLGMFEITLPSSLVNKIDAQADKGGILGPFFMAFTLVVVSFSCTGPIVGSVLVEAADGQFLKPIVAMLSFGTAIALPFTLFAIFPDMLSNLPKSGGWLNSVKVVLGFIEIALGLKFLGVADQVYGWGILDREIYLSIWIAIFILITLYLLGKFKLANDSDTENIGVPRLLLAMLSLSFVIYMIPGLWGAPLKELTGYLPPMSTQEDYHNTEGIVRNVVLEIMEDQNFSKDPNSKTANKLCDSNPKYSDKLHLPHGLKGYFDVEEALICAKEQNKPLFIDFTGHGCVNCRKMEEEVWRDSKVLSRLRKDYIIVALYCDDKKVKLPKEEWLTSKRDTTEMLKTVGDINSEYQAIEFSSNSQPQYILMGPDGKKLSGVQPRAYNTDIDEFIEFLDAGKVSFEAKFK